MLAVVTISHDIEDPLDRWIRIDPRNERRYRFLTGWFWQHGFRPAYEGADHIPRTGGVLITPNHSSYADPLLLAYGQHRVLRFMAKSSLFVVPGFRRIMQTGGGYPVRRGASDAGAMQMSLRLLRDGQPVVIYPEGTRYRDALELGPPRRGAARLALESGVPVVPVGTWGAKRRQLYGRPRWRRPRVTMVYGEALRFDELELTAENVEVVRDAIWAGVEAAYARARELGEQRMS